MIRGESVWVEPVSVSAADPFGAGEQVAGEPFEVANVVVAPSGSSAISDSTRPDGVSATYTLHFPKTFDGSLRGLRVKVRGEWFHVVGDPQRYTSANVPGDWDMAVEVSRSDG